MAGHLIRCRAVGPSAPRSRSTHRRGRISGVSQIPVKLLVNGRVWVSPTPKLLRWRCGDAVAWLGSDDVGRDQFL